MREYFYSDDGKAVGPVSLEELKTKRIEPDTLVWYEGLSDWTTANDIEELKNLFVKETPASTPHPHETNQQNANSYGAASTNTPSRKSGKGLVVFLIVLGFAIVVTSIYIISTVVIGKDEPIETAYREPTPIDGVWDFYYNYEDYGLNISGGLADGRYYVRSVSFDGSNLTFSYSYKSGRVSGTVNSNGSFSGTYTTSSSTGPVYMRFDSDGEAYGEWECDDCFLPISGDMWIDKDY